MRDGLIARNPMAGMVQPKVERTDATYLSPADVSALLAAARSSRQYSLLALIAATGLRKGEALALTWEDVDLDAGTLRVRGTLARVNGELVVTEPKTPTSRRTLALTPSVVSLLKSHRETQLFERRRACDLWRETGHVFTNEFGAPVDPRNLLRVVTVAAKEANLEGVNVHTLRHSAAAAWLESGVSLKAVSELLVHADAAITARVYAHVSPETRAAAMAVLSDAIGL